MSSNRVAIKAHAEVLTTYLPSDSLGVVARALRIQAMDRVSDALPNLSDWETDFAADLVREMADNAEDPGLFDPNCTGILRVVGDEETTRVLVIEHDDRTCPIHEDTLPYVVGVSLPNSGGRNLRRFATHDEAAEFVGDLEDHESGIYYIDGPEQTGV